MKGGGLAGWDSAALFMHDRTRTQDGHRCLGSEEVGNQGSGQPRASLANSPTECLATKGRTIKANHSDSLGTRLIGKQNPRIQHVSPTPRGLTPACFHPGRSLSLCSPAPSPLPTPLTSSVLLPPLPSPTVSLSLAHIPLILSLADLGSILG